MSKETPSVKKESQKRWFVPSLAIASLATALSNTLLTLLLLEIAQTFQVNEGVAAQLRTVNAAAEVVFALLMSFLAVKFRNKTLLLVGVFSTAVSALGSFFAPTLDLMLFFSFMEGAGTVMVSIMAFTIVGDSLPQEKKATAVSLIVAVSFLSTLIGTPVINLLADVGGWRFPYLLLVFPFSIVGLLLALFGVPSSKSKKPVDSKQTYVRNFKQVILNRSAASCVIGNLFFTGTAVTLFALAFFRQNFFLQREDTVYITLVSASIYIVGSLVTSKLGNRLATKSMTVMSTFGCGLFTILMFFASNLWLSLAFNFLRVWFTGMTASAYQCLALEQVPESRSTMLSLNRLFTGIGYTIAPAIGGTLLVMFSLQSVEVGYQAVGVAIGGMSIFAALILFLYAKDPFKKCKPTVVNEQNRSVN
jgi:predicted MFS family arabinose efflux permease